MLQNVIKNRMLIRLEEPGDRFPERSQVADLPSVPSFSFIIESAFAHQILQTLCAMMSIRFLPGKDVSQQKPAVLECDDRSMQRSASAEDQHTRSFLHHMEKRIGPLATPLLVLFRYS